MGREIIRAVDWIFPKNGRRYDLIRDDIPGDQVLSTFEEWEWQGPHAELTHGRRLGSRNGWEMDVVREDSDDEGFVRVIGFHKLPPKKPWNGSRYTHSPLSVQDYFVGPHTRTGTVTTPGPMNEQVRGMPLVPKFMEEGVLYQTDTDLWFKWWTWWDKRNLRVIETGEEPESDLEYVEHFGTIEYRMTSRWWDDWLYYREKYTGFTDKEGDVRYYDRTIFFREGIGMTGFSSSIDQVGIGLAKARDR